MWYVKDEFSDKVYFQSTDVRKTQSFANHYNNNKKFSGQRMFKFNLYSFAPLSFFKEDKIDVNQFTEKFSIFEPIHYVHPLAIKGFDKKHKLYRKNKVELVTKLCKKYHLWSYNGKGRKCDGFDL